MPPEGQTSGLAIAGLISAFLCGLLGLILSIAALGTCRNSGGKIRGEGLAIAGIIISAINIFLGLAITLGSRGGAP